MNLKQFAFYLFFTIAVSECYCTGYHGTCHDRVDQTDANCGRLLVIITNEHAQEYLSRSNAAR